MDEDDTEKKFQFINWITHNKLIGFLILFFTGILRVSEWKRVPILPQVWIRSHKALVPGMVDNPQVADQGALKVLSETGVLQWKLAQIKFRIYLEVICKGAFCNYGF